MPNETPFPLVTVIMMDWYTQDNVLALPLPRMTQAEVDRAWVAPNHGIKDYLDRVDEAFGFKSPGHDWKGIDNPPPWEFRGVRWAEPNSNGLPDILPGETFVPGGPAMVTRMIEAVALYEELAAAEALDGNEPAPYELPWEQITRAYLGGLKDRIEALNTTAPPGL